MAKKLRCDRCGLELTEKDDLSMASDGMKAWRATARARGIQPRGVLPCKNYIRCGGEIVKVVWWREWLRRMLSSGDSKTGGVTNQRNVR